MAANDPIQFPSLLEGYAWLDGHINFERRLGDIHYSAETFGLDHFRERLHRLGNPHLGLKTIHIAGTRGKGSSALMLEALLRSLGLRTALFTSPHVYEYRERIRIDGESVAPTVFLRCLEKVASVGGDEKEPPHPTGFKTVFENLTALFLLIAREEQVDWAIVETGLGGRLDATNVLDPGPVLLTRIGLEHTHLLGSTIEAIAGEKAAILKPGGWGVFGTQVPFEINQTGAEAVFRRRAEETGSELFPAEEISPLREVVPRHDGLSVSLSIEDDEIRFDLPLLGPFQAENLQNALAMLTILRGKAAIPYFTPSELPASLQRLRIPGRMERVSCNPELIVDAAHCPTGAAALAAAMTAHFGDEPADLLLAIMADKDHVGFLRALSQWKGWRTVYCYQLDTPRALPATQLAASAAQFFAKVRNCTNLAYALESWLGDAEKQDRAVATGTLYTVAHLLDWGRRRATTTDECNIPAAATQTEPLTNSGDP